MKIQKASRKKVKLKIGLFAPSGGGKTYSSLKMARGMCDSWEEICIIDTEKGSGELYSDLGEYNTIRLDAPYAPENYVKAIELAEKSGMKVIIVDSISHEWDGKGGILEIVSSAVGNSYTAWGKITPRHNKFIDAILSANCHVICCGRTKQDYVLNERQNKNGRTVQVPEKVGMKAVTRDGFDYELTVSFDIDINHQAHTTKDRTDLFSNEPEFVINEETGKRLIEWVNSGKDDEKIIKIRSLIDNKREKKILDHFEITSLENLSEAQKEALILKLTKTEEATNTES